MAEFQNQQALLSIDKLCCERDGRRLFEGLNATIVPGDIVQISGANGVGKTSLLRILTTLADHSAGQILWQGRPIQHNRFAYLSSILYLAHQAAIKLALTPCENIQFFLGLHGNPTGISVNEVLQQLGLTNYVHSPCQQLSAGQQRRVALAKLLLSQALLWILDEPFTAIDKQGAVDLENLIVKQAQRGGAVILTTHQALNIDGVKHIDLGNYQPRAIDA